MSKKKIVVFGPGPLFKGGLANYTTSLAKAFAKMPDIEVHLISWSQQYPAIVPRDFIDRKTKADKLGGLPVTIQYLTNYNNPFTWLETVRTIKDINPEMVIFQWSVAIQGLPLGFIAKKLFGCSIKVVFDLHFVIQKEESAIDRMFTKYALKKSDAYVVHAYKTVTELEQLYPNKKFNLLDNGFQNPEKPGNIIKLFHPVYDMFKINPDFDIEEQKRKLGLKKHVFLFFGFIRKYKGLHFCIEAFAKFARDRDDVSLLIVGESFWQTLDNKKFSTKVKQAVFGTAKKLLLKSDSDEKDYNPLAMIDTFGIRDKTVVVNDFVGDEEVHKYFQVSDCILLFYEYATPSGVESMANNFKMPVLASAVGHFPETIIPGKNGYLAEGANTDSMASAMQQFLDHPIERDNVELMAKELSWDNYANTILNFTK
jgi:glycosyltransferase involved in cell wall biosynthesis